MLTPDEITAARQQLGVNPSSIPTTASSTGAPSLADTIRQAAGIKTAAPATPPAAITKQTPDLTLQQSAELAQTGKTTAAPAEEQAPAAPKSEDPLDQHPILKTLGAITGVTDLGKGMAQAIFLNLTPEGKKAQEDLQSGRITPAQFDDIVGGGLETNKAIIGSALQTALTVGTAGLGSGEAAGAKAGAKATEEAIAAAKAAAPGLGARILKAGGTGAALGGAGGAINAFGEGDSAGDIAKKTLEGGAAGAALGGTSEVAATGLGKIAAAGKSLLEDAAGHIDKTTGADAALAEKTASNANKSTAAVETTVVDGKKKPGIVATAVGKTMGVQPSTVHDIYTQPDKFTPEAMKTASRQANAEFVHAGINKGLNDLEASKMGAGVDARGLADQVKAGLDKHEKDLEAKAKDYGSITGSRTPGSTEGPSIKVDPNFLQKQIAKATGRTVSKGKIDMAPNLASSVRDPKDLAALQKWLDTRHPGLAKGTLSGNEFLNLRDDLTGLSHFDKSGGMPSTALEKVGKQVRAALNDTYRSRFKGLEQADKAYETKVTDLNRLRTGLIDNNGDLSENAMTRILSSTGKDKFAIGDKLEEIVPGIKKQVAKLKDIERQQQQLRAGIVDEKGNLLDGAANRIHNITGVGKDQISERLEKIAPGINDRVRFVKVVEDLGNSTMTKAGTYERAALGVAGVAGVLVGHPWALAAWVVSHPDVAVPTLRKMGYAAGNAEKIAADLGIEAAK